MKIDRVGIVSIRKKTSKNKQIFIDRVRNDRVRYDRVRSDRFRNDRVRSDRVRNDRVRNDRARNDSKPILIQTIIIYQIYTTDAM